MKRPVGHGVGEQAAGHSVSSNLHYIGLWKVFLFVVHKGLQTYELIRKIKDEAW